MRLKMQKIAMARELTCQKTVDDLPLFDKLYDCAAT